ncbi:MAG: hypothetical protein M3P29_03325, partial [Acidobacteriota bacterium]|nr:hypothetical protein [Acidobacteriota bacterium]
MKVPAWHDTSPAASRGHIAAAARRVVHLGIAALIVACGENVTAPSAARNPTISGAPSPDLIVMERTTDIAAHDGVAAIHQTSTRTLTPQTRIAPQEQISRPAGAGAKIDVAQLPLPPTSLSARYERAMCSALPAWTRTVRASVGIDTELKGVGDAPASTLRLVQEGKTVATVERNWVRTPTSWQLERQVTTTADGLYRDVVTYRHLSAATKLTANNALPTAACVTPSSATIASPAAVSRSYYAPRGNLMLSPPVDVLGYYGCGDSYGGDPCFDYQMDVYEADAAVAVAASLMTFACKIGLKTPVTLATCGAAVVAYGASLAVLYVKQAKLDNCRAAQAAGECGCSGGGTGGTELMSLGTTPSSVSPSISASPGSSSAINAPETRPSFDCYGTDYT